MAARRIVICCSEAPSGEYESIIVLTISSGAIWLILVLPSGEY